MLLNRVCCSTTSVIVREGEFKVMQQGTLANSCKLVICRLFISLPVSLALCSREIRTEEGKVAWKKGRDKKQFLFHPFWFICWFIYLLPYLYVIFFVVRANTEEMEKALHLLVKTFLLFSQKLYLTIEVVLERTKMESFPVWFRQREIHQTIIAGLRKAS